MGGFIRECDVMNLTLSRAFRLIPSNTKSILEWYRDNEGEKCDKLPMTLRTKDGLALCRQSGIYTPSAALVKFEGGRKYAFAIHSSHRDVYADKKQIQLKDGTWIYEYAKHTGRDKSQGYNEALLNCLEDGVPVGVIVPEKRGGYRILGLAYVEHYNSVSGMFTLHGPVNERTEAMGCFCFRGADALTEQEQKQLGQLDDLKLSDDDRRRVVAYRQVQREQQDRFRKNLLEAYAGSCAITRTNVSEVLQAAHIKPYRGKQSQIVNNGILLRADMHLLFDAHLLSVEPETMRVHLSQRLGESNYRGYGGQEIAVPQNASFAPDRDLIAAHYEQFVIENGGMVLV